MREMCRVASALTTTIRIIIIKESAPSNKALRKIYKLKWARSIDEAYALNLEI